MNCPRCASPLNDVDLPELKSAKVHICPSCEGTWYPKTALNAVAQAEREWLEKTEVGVVLEGDKLDQIDLEAAVFCPVCEQEMKRYNYALATDVELDECIEHGIWLDDGELGVIMDKISEHKELSEKARADIERVRREMGLEQAAKGSALNPFALTLRLLNKIFS